MLQREDLIGNEYFQRLGVPDQATFKTIQNILKKKSYCEILGVPPDASIASIKEAYRKLALVFHPDRYCSNQAKMDKGFNETDVKKLAEAVMHVINTAYPKLLEWARPNNSETPRQRAPSPIEILFPPLPPVVTKDSVREFITKMELEVSGIITKSKDREQYQHVMLAMTALQKKIDEFKELLLPGLQPLSSASSNNTQTDSQALQRKIGSNDFLHKNFHVFILECLNEVEDVTNVLAENDPDQKAEPTSCQIALKFLQFILQKMYKLLTFDSTPVYKEGLYMGLFQPKINTKNALDKVKSNLSSEKQMAEDVERTMTDQNCCTSYAIWR